MGAIPSYVWHCVGPDQDGPKVLVLGGTHGDELTGIELVRDWLRVVNPENNLLPCDAGSFWTPGIKGNLFLGFGNPEAIIRGTRAASDYTKGGSSQPLDLNRCFDPALLEGDGDWTDLRRARELQPLLHQVDYLFDIHAVSQQGSNPFVCFGRMTPEHERLCRMIPVSHVLTDPDCQLGVPEGRCVLPTTDEAVNAHGGSRWGEARFGTRRGVGLCYETGYEHDLEKVPMAKLVIANLLLGLGVVDAATHERLTPKGEELTKAQKCLDTFNHAQQKRMALKTVVCSKESDFVHEPGLTADWTPVAKGDLIGRYLDGTPVMSPTDGHVVFSTSRKKIRIGGPLLYIARELL